MEITTMAQMFTQKYTIVQLFEELNDGYEYSSDNWPLHSTIVDTFAINWSIDDMASKLTDAIRGHAITRSVARDNRNFGEDGQIQVTLLDRTKSLVNLHNDVLKILEEGGLVLNDPQFARDGFLPHATVQKHARLNKGDTVQFDALSIIDMFPGEDPYRRKVLKTIKFGH